MSQLEIIRNSLSAEPKTKAKAYVPSLQRTKGNRRPIAANGGLSYMSLDRNGDAGTAAALQDALAEISGGEGQRVIDMIDKAPPGPIETSWGLGFRDYDACLTTSATKGITAPEGGVGAAAALHGL